MGKPKVRAVMQKVMHGAKKNSPVILLVAGLAGGVATVITTIKQTVSAKADIDEATAYKQCETGDPEAKLTPKEIIKVVWKRYIPVLALTAAFIILILSSAGIVHRRYESIAAAYGLLSATHDEYVNKVVETIGEKKEQDIRDKIAIDKANEIEAKSPGIIDTGRGNTLFIETLSGQEFYSSYETVKAACNRLNEQMFQSPMTYVLVDELLDGLGIPNPDFQLGSKLCWELETGLIDLRFTTKMSVDGETPAVVIEHKRMPHYI